MISKTLKVFIFFSLILVLGCQDSRESYEQMRKREYDMWHQTPPVSFEQMKTDLYGKTMKAKCKSWMFKESDENKLEIEACRRINEYYRVYLNADCRKPNIKDTKLLGVIIMEYTEDGNLKRISSNTAEIIEVIE